MNKALMKAATTDLLGAVRAAAIGHTIRKVVGDDVANSMFADSADKLLYLGVLRFHGLLPDEWILASIARQWTFLARDGVLPRDEDFLRKLQKKCSSLLDISAESYVAQMKKLGVEVEKQPRFGEDVGAATHQLLEKISGHAS